MSEKELNSYRFLSGEEPTDEQLEGIMQAALDCAISRRREAEEKVKAEIQRMRRLQREKWGSLRSNLRNG